MKEQLFVFHLINFSHKLDLMRCYPAEGFHHSITACLNGVVYFSEEMNAALAKLLHIVANRNLAVGNQLTCIIKNGQLVNTFIDYDRELFPSASKEPFTCWQMIHDGQRSESNNVKRGKKSHIPHLSPTDVNPANYKSSFMAI